MVMGEHLPNAAEGDEDSQTEPMAQLRSSKRKSRLPVREGEESDKESAPKKLKSTEAPSEGQGGGRRRRKQWVRASCKERSGKGLSRLVGWKGLLDSGVAASFGGLAAGSMTSDATGSLGWTIKAYGLLRRDMRLTRAGNGFHPWVEVQAATQKWALALAPMPGLRVIQMGQDCNPSSQVGF
ncbi:hypothetical protein BJV78DRAFT_1157933 [Lactifluus subvellereus]|nr:hypothetical protein BJV78DRAFT_1157933 [Lactifluus subvellereus]